MTKALHPPVPLLLLAALLALGVRLWHIDDVQLQFDEWLGGWHANPPVLEGASPAGWAKNLSENVRHYVTSGQTITWSALVEIIKLIAGKNIMAVRLIAAFGGAFGALAVAWLGWRLFAGNLWATAAAAAVAVFSVPGIIFGQFADVYAGAIWASSLQMTVYFLWTRRRKTTGSWLVFALSALISQLLMYTQLWLTAGIFLGAIWESFLREKPGREARRIAPAGILYTTLSVLHLGASLRLIPWSESFRWYMFAYYPMFWRGETGGASLFQIGGYFIWRIYDLFTYQLALVFDPAVYQPLQWTWVSLPFLFVLIMGISSWMALRRSPKNGQRSAVSSKYYRHLAAYRLPLTMDNSVPRLVVTTLIVCLLANAFFLIPFGGIRQMFFLLPLMALFYGWLVYMVVILLGSSVTPVTTEFNLRSRAHFKRCGYPKLFLSWLLILIPVLPFGLSYSALYRDRISRLDLDAIVKAMEEYQPEAVIASEQNIHILEMALNDDPRFTNINWPGYPYPSDALDADFVRSFPTLEFNYNGRPWKVHWVKRGYFPREIKKAVWIDMHISRNSRFEGEQMRRFYSPPDEVVPRDYRIVPLREVPGNSPAALHQSIYWPPNSFYLYLVSRKPSGQLRAEENK